MIESIDLGIDEFKIESNIIDASKINTFYIKFSLRSCP